MYSGWYLAAYEREFTDALLGVSIGDVEIMLIRGTEGIRAYRSICPHRGARLVPAGKLDGNAVICPFHGRRIGLDEPGDDGFCLSSYPTLAVGGLIFVRMSDAFENGFSDLMQTLDQTYHFVPGFTMRVRTTPEFVIENAFDRRHFKFVHGLPHVPDLCLEQQQNGAMTVSGSFRLSRANSWQAQSTAAGEDTAMGVTLRVFSPTLCVTELSDAAHKYFVITGATPGGDGECRVRVSVALAGSPDGSPPDQNLVRALLRDSKVSIEQDKAVWEQLVPKAPIGWAPDDDLIIEFHKFCAKFRQSRA
ncbi:MAG: Rieske 2Fe-2S domain-containing protein [Bryobacteraceae bacterium]|nr:Rieske 2Fe-2S domain-containing protein [Bryobacteraceae bacterium]